MKRLLLFFAAACLYHTALAQVPETGRWQDLDFGREEVHAHAADEYRQMLDALAHDGRLDDDILVVRRVKAIAPGLIEAAIATRPEAAWWNWEIHTTSAHGIDAFSMAGGKLVIGSSFVRRLDLDDGELATLIAHEVAHVIADHHREYLSSVLHVSPLPSNSLEVTSMRLDTDFSLRIRLSQLSHIQEREADQLGIILAHRASWPTAAMVRFYAKLARSETQSAFGSSHPRAGSRLSMAHGMRKLLGE